jgi:hypothetical protein
MEAASGSVIPTKLCVLDAATPAKWHRAQQFTGGKNIGVPATLARNCILEVTHPVNLTEMPDALLWPTTG